MELAATRRNLKHTQHDLTKVQTSFEQQQQRQQALADELAERERSMAAHASRLSDAGLSRAGEEAQEERPSAADAEALAALEAAKEAELQALRDRLDEEAERTRQLQRLLDQQSLLAAEQEAEMEMSLGDSLADEMGRMATLDQARAEAEAKAAVEVARLREAAAADLRAMQEAKEAAAADLRAMQEARAAERAERERVEAMLQALQSQMEQARTAQEKLELETQLARQQGEAARQALAQREAEDARLRKEQADLEYAEQLRRAFEEDQRRAEAAKAEAQAKRESTRKMMLEQLCKMFPSIPPPSIQAVAEHHKWHMDATCKALATMVQTAALGSARLVAVQPACSPAAKEQSSMERQRATKERLAELVRLKKERLAAEEKKKQDQARRDAQRREQLLREQEERQAQRDANRPLFVTRSPPIQEDQNQQLAPMPGYLMDASLSFSKDMRRDATFKVVLPSQEKFYDVLVEDNPDAQYLGLGTKWTADCTLKCSPTYVSQLAAPSRIPLAPLRRGRGEGGRITHYA